MLRKYTGEDAKKEMLLSVKDGKEQLIIMIVINIAC